MGLIKYGPNVARISGKIGGTVYAFNKGGAYARLWSVPVDPQSNDQLQARQILSGQSQAWQALTDAQRESWANWANQNLVTNRLGDQIQLSGHQAFVGLNSRLEHSGSTTLTAPPISAPPLSLDTLTLTADIGTVDFDLAFAETPLGANVVLWILAAVVNSAGIKYVRNRYRFVGNSGAAQVSPFDIETLVAAQFGTLVVGQTVHTLVSTFDTSTGLISVPLHAQDVIVDTP